VPFNSSSLEQACQWVGFAHQGSTRVGSSPSAEGRTRGRGENRRGCSLQKGLSLGDNIMAGRGRPNRKNDACAKGAVRYRRTDTACPLETLNGFRAASRICLPPIG